MTILTTDQVRQILIDGGCPDIAELPDTRYAVPLLEWVTDSFGPALEKLFSQLDFSYKDDSRDCDDFSRFAAAYAGLLHSYCQPTVNLLGLEGNVSGFALGEFWFSQDTGGGHAICVALVCDTPGSKPYAAFFEPQVGMRRLYPSDREKMSAQHIEI